MSTKPASASTAAYCPGVGSTGLPVGREIPAWPAPLEAPSGSPRYCRIRRTQGHPATRDQSAIHGSRRPRRFQVPSEGLRSRTLRRTPGRSPKPGRRHSGRPVRAIRQPPGLRGSVHADHPATGGDQTLGERPVTAPRSSIRSPGTGSRRSSTTCPNAERRRRARRSRSPPTRCRLMGRVLRPGQKATADCASDTAGCECACRSSARTSIGR